MLHNLNKARGLSGNMWILLVIPPLAFLICNWVACIGCFSSFLRLLGLFIEQTVYDIQLLLPLFLALLGQLLLLKQETPGAKS